MLARRYRIPKKKVLQILEYFAGDVSSSQAARFARVSTNCTYRYYRHFREIIFQHMRRAPRLFGEIEMDQSEFGGRGRKELEDELGELKKTLPWQEYSERAKFIRLKHKINVFGIMQRGGDVYTHVVQKMDAATLTPIVRLVVEKGATVFTDKWGGFHELKLDGYTHNTVNHSVEYVGPNGEHINNIESFWAFAKDRLAKFHGIPKRLLPLHLKECEFRWNHRRDIQAALRSLILPDSRSRTGKAANPRPPKLREKPARQISASRFRRTDQADTLQPLE